MYTHVYTPMHVYKHMSTPIHMPIYSHIYIVMHIKHFYPLTHTHMQTHMHTDTVSPYTQIRPISPLSLALCPTVPPFPALLSAVRINGDGQEILFLAEGDNVRLGCPYILDPEDVGNNALDIEWMQLNSDPAHRENMVRTSKHHCAPSRLDSLGASLPSGLPGSVSLSPLLTVPELPG